MNISKLEDLFIEKLSEKYKLTERGLKNVFAKLDTSKDGLLDIDELFVFIKNLLNGIKIEDVKKLVQTYDVNGDGSISFEEFFDMVTNRKIPATSRVKAIPREDTTNLEYGSENGSFASTPLKGGRRRDVVSAWDEDESEYDDASAPSMQGGKGNGEYDRSGLSSARSTTSTSTHVSLSDRQAIESRAALFLRNLRTFLMKEATRMRDTGKVNITQRLGMHSSQLIETIARALLQRHFKPYTLIEGRASAANMPCKFTDFCVARSDFSRVLRSFVIPGTAAPQTIIIDFLFSLCCSETAAPIGDQLASASLFAERVFPTPKPQTTVAPPAEFNAMDTIRNGAKVDRHPLSEEHLAVRRAEVGRGPLKNKDTCLPLAISDLPLKFVSRKSRTSLLASSTIDAVSLNRSSQLPPYTCIR